MIYNKNFIFYFLSQVFDQTKLDGEPMSKQLKRIYDEDQATHNETESNIAFQNLIPNTT